MALYRSSTMAQARLQRLRRVQGLRRTQVLALQRMEECGESMGTYKPSSTQTYSMKPHGMLQGQDPLTCAMSGQTEWTPSQPLKLSTASLSSSVHAVSSCGNPRLQEPWD